jgi:small subunit ribosomal protein S20
MPNIRQQKKRVRTAGQERLGNLRYRSTVKTLAKRLEAAVAGGDPERVAAEHRELVRWIDRAAAKGALHRNTAARRKAQAARLVTPAAQPAAPPAGPKAKPAAKAEAAAKPKPKRGLRGRRSK